MPVLSGIRTTSWRCVCCFRNLASVTLLAITETDRTGFMQLVNTIPRRIGSHDAGCEWTRPDPDDRLAALAVGLRSDHAWYDKYLEVGYVFGRKTEFLNSVPNFNIGDGLMLRLGSGSKTMWRDATRGILAIRRKRANVGRPLMARWPDNWKSNLLGFAIVFVFFPLLCLLAWWWLRWIRHSSK